MTDVNKTAASIAGSISDAELRAEGDPGNSAAALPDPEPLPSSLLPVARFNFDMLPERLRPWIEDAAERLQVPPEFIAVPAMVALGTVVGRKMLVRPKRADSWTACPNLWGMIIGASGTLKSACTSEGLRPLRSLEEAARRGFRLKQTDYRTTDQAKKAIERARVKRAEAAAKQMLDQNPNATVGAIKGLFEPPKEAEQLVAPHQRRYTTVNPTLAGLREVLLRNLNGVLIVRDELMTLLHHLDGQANSELRGFLLVGYDGNTPYSFDRATGNGLDQHLEAVTLSVIGGGQPQLLTTYIERMRRTRRDDGLIARFSLAVWPDIPSTWQNVDRAPNRTAYEGACEVFRKLDQLDQRQAGAQRDRPAGDEEGAYYMRLSAGAYEQFGPWLGELEQRIRSRELAPELEAHLAKYRKAAAALALLTHLAEVGAGDVSALAMEKALKWVGFLESHAVRLYRSQEVVAAHAARLIMGRIERGDLPKKFRGKDVWRPGWSQLADRNLVHTALDLLVQHRHLSVNEKIDTGGRPARIFTVNPGALPKLPER